MLHKIIRGIAPIVAIAFAAGLAGCDNATITVGDTEGVPLAELDTSGPAPTKIVLAGPDTVILAEGETLAIEVGGDPAVAKVLRFAIDDGTLAILRDPKADRVDGTAQVRVTMPAPDNLVIAGSGTIEAATLAASSEIAIGGSGKIKVAQVRSEKLEVVIAGSGGIEAAGTVDRLELNLAGSGSARMAGLSAERAELNIAGSGDAEFASDGRVEGNIIGSGDVRVTGSAKCTIKSVGSGTLTCQSGPAQPAAGTQTGDAAPAEDTGNEETGETP